VKRQQVGWLTCWIARANEHPASHLAKFCGTLQAHGFAGFNHLPDSINRLYESGAAVETGMLGGRATDMIFMKRINNRRRQEKALERIPKLWSREEILWSAT
jgi:hypothetical protein